MTQLSDNEPEPQHQGAAATTLDADRLWELIQAGRGLVAELDAERLFGELLEVARRVTGARYAALGILDEHRTELERFITRGIEPEQHRAIGDLPRGRGILGLLIQDPQPLRLSAIGEHPKAYGFPPGHPPMRNFLGVPILVRHQAFGNLYLTDKADGEFDEADEQAVVILAAWAAIAVENARLYGETASRRDELERANRGLQAATTIARAVGAETDLDALLDLVVKRARALVDARTLVIWLQEGDELAVAACAGEVPPGGGDARVPLVGTVSGEVARSGIGERIGDAGAALRLSLNRLGLEASAALLVPLSFRGHVSGLMAAYDHLGPERRFSEEDEELLKGFAASAATAVATAQSVADDRLRQRLRAAEQERGRWARELHDETLQSLASLVVGLRSARRSQEQSMEEEAMDAAVAQLQEEIRNLRALITQLRPAALDELGVKAALEGLVDRIDPDRTTVELKVDLDYEGGRRSTRHAPELEATIYRLVQEALNNAITHADAQTIRIEVVEYDGTVTIIVADDGAGFDTAQRSEGFGVLGMNERVALAEGTLKITSEPGEGTTVLATLPVPHRPQP
jgi:signal transduction histidine kinase